MIRAAAIAATAVALSACAPVEPETTAPAVDSRYSAADEAVYAARHRRLFEADGVGTGLDAYDPLEPVPGADTPTLVPTRAETVLSKEAIATAEAYAAARNSSAFLIWKDGAIVHESYYGDFDVNTPIVSKSLAKPVTALIVGRAMQDGYITDLDAPVATWITEWQGDPEREKITLRMLLQMRSGLLEQGFSVDRDDILNRAYLHPRHDEVIINDYPLTDEPGSIYDYSNANSELIAPIIERATGKRYSEYVSEGLLKPLGAMGGYVWVNREGGMAHSGCCILLPAQTWLKFAMLVMNDGVWQGSRILPAGWVETMRTGSAENQYYGIGLWLPGTYIERRGFANPEIPYGKVFHSEPYLDKDIMLFDGNSNQVAYMIPSENMIVLRTGASPPKDAEWDNAYLPNLLITDANRAPGDEMPEPQPR